MLHPFLVRFREEIKIKNDLHKNLIENEKRNAKKEVLNSVRKLIDSNSQESGKSKKIRKIQQLFHS